MQPDEIQALIDKSEDHNRASALLWLMNAIWDVDGTTPQWADTFSRALPQPGSDDPYGYEDARYWAAELDGVPAPMEPHDDDHRLERWTFPDNSVAEVIVMMPPRSRAMVGAGIISAA